MSSSEVSNATDERPLLESQNEESSTYEMVDQSGEIKKNSNDKLVKSSRTSNNSALERYEKGRLMLITAFTIVGVVVFLAATASLGLISRPKRRMDSINAGDIVAVPANGMSGVDKEIPEALVRKEEKMIREDEVTHKEESNPQPSDGPEFYTPDLRFEPAINYNMENQNSEQREDSTASSPPEIELKSTRQSMFDDDAIDALIASAERYAEEIAVNNDTYLDAQLQAIFYRLRSNPKELLKVEFDERREEHEEEEDSLQREEEDSLQREEVPETNGLARGGDVSETSNNDWEASEANDEEEDAWGERVGDSRSNFRSESSRNGKYKDVDDDDVVVDEPRGKAANSNGEAANDFGDSEEGNVDENRFFGNFWDFVKRFAMDWLSVSSNFWYSVVGSSGEEDEAKEKEGETEVEEKMGQVEEEEREEEMGEMEREDKESNFEPREGVKMPENGTEEGSKKSQLKLLIAKVRKAVRESERRGFRARRRKATKHQNHKLL